MMPNERLAQLLVISTMLARIGTTSRNAADQRRDTQGQSSRESVHQLKTDRAIGNATDDESLCIDGITPVVVDTIDSDVKKNGAFVDKHINDKPVEMKVKT